MDFYKFANKTNPKLKNNLAASSNALKNSLKIKKKSIGYKTLTGPHICVTTLLIINSCF